MLKNLFYFNIFYKFVVLLQIKKNNIMSKIKNYIDVEIEQGNDVLNSTNDEDIDFDYYQSETEIA